LPPRSLPQPSRELDEQRVAGGVTERVVHGLEPVEVDEERGDGITAPLRRDERTTEHPHPIVPPFTVAIQPFQSVDRRIPIRPSQLGLGRARVRGNGGAAETMNVVDDIAPVARQRVG